MPPSCDKRWKFSAAHFQISDLTGALVRGILSCAEEKNESKSQGGGQGGGEGGGQGGGWVAKRYFENEEEYEFGFPFHSYFSFGWLPRLLSKCIFRYFFGYFSKVYFQRVFLETKGEGIWREAIWRGGEVTAAIFCLYRHFRWHFHPLQQSRRLYRDILIDSEQLTNLRLDLSQYYKAQHLSRSSQHRWIPGKSHRGARQGMVRAWRSVFVKCECVCIYNTYIYTNMCILQGDKGHRGRNWVDWNQWVRSSSAIKLI